MVHLQHLLHLIQQLQYSQQHQQFHLLSLAAVVQEEEMTYLAAVVVQAVLCTAHHKQFRVALHTT
jgi:hypothetical protein